MLIEFLVQSICTFFLAIISRSVKQIRRVFDDNFLEFAIKNIRCGYSLESPLESEVILMSTVEASAWPNG